MEFSKVNYFMSIALDEAHKAYSRREVPVGCVIVDSAGEIVARAHNTKEEQKNPCHHAEILAITKACEKADAWRLIDFSLYVTLEPCPMCLSAISQSRIKSLYFGAYDPKGGAISLGYNLHADTRLNHNLRVFGGNKHIECSKILSDFFKSKRKNHSK